MLEKWKAEKELKKKLESRQNAKKPTFRVTHAGSDVLDFAKPMAPLPKVLADTKKAPATQPAKPAKSAAASTNEGPNSRTRNRTTRASTASAAAKAAPPKKKTPVRKAVARSTSKASTGTETRTTRASRAAAFKNAKPSTTQKKKTAVEPAESPPPQNVVDVSSSSNVNSLRGGNSFAPNDYKFVAPDHLEPFEFKAMSPTCVKSLLSISPNAQPSARRLVIINTTLVHRIILLV